jgi:four helix bundle protein
LKISKGSVGEVRNQLYIALAIGYVTKEEFEKANKDLENLASQIGGFIQYLEKKKKEQPIRNSLIR